MEQQFKNREKKIAAGRLGRTPEFEGSQNWWVHQVVPLWPKGELYTRQPEVNAGADRTQGESHLLWLKKWERRFISRECRNLFLFFPFSTVCAEMAVTVLGNPRSQSPKEGDPSSLFGKVVVLRG